RDEVERVAQVPSNGPLGHVRSDHAHAPLAVFPEGPDQRRRPGRPRGRHENRCHLRIIESFGPSASGSRAPSRGTSAQAEFTFTSSATRTPSSRSAAHAVRNSKLMHSYECSLSCMKKSIWPTGWSGGGSSS